MEVLIISTRLTDEGETFGYYGRAWSHEDRTEIGSWALQEMLIMCAPPFIAATIYMFLGRIIRSFDAEHHASVCPKWLTPIFVLNDIICFITQMAGAGVQVTGDAHVMDIGKKATLAGLIFSLIVFCFFVLIAAVFHRRCNRDPTPMLLHNPKLNWERYMRALYISCFAVMLRNLIRLIQFGSDKESPLNTKEVFIYVFDAVPMLLSMVILMAYHPGLLIKRARNAQKGEILMSDRKSGEVPLAQYMGSRV